MNKRTTPRPEWHYDAVMAGVFLAVVLGLAAIIWGLLVLGSVVLG